jgi:hypothetical protein
VASLYRSTDAATYSSPDHDKMISSSIQLSALPETEERRAEVGMGNRSEAAAAVPPQHTQKANSQVSADQAKRTGDGATEFGVRGKSDRPRSQRTSHRSERKLVLMTMRTIRFPDGRQVTKLIPYRGRERVLALSANE